MPKEEQKFIDLETGFWQSMVDKDAKLARTMIADECLITGPMGSMKIDPVKYEAMTESGDWELISFSITDADVILPNDETAIVAYKVHQKGRMKGATMDLKCADNTTWVREGPTWKCALHTETILKT